MPVQITSLLEGFFLAGEADRTRRYTAETMLEELNVMAEEGQFDKSEVPKPPNYPWVDNQLCCSI